jgi:tripartite-type tricarboxylate transporter receptor subunit TctC
MRRATVSGRGVRALAGKVMAAAIALGIATPGTAAGFPDHPIKLIVPFGPGGPPDVAARIIGAYLSEHLGTVVVENHVGAGGTLAARLVATSPPDGYALLAGTAGSLSISP